MCVTQSAAPPIRRARSDSRVYITDVNMFHFYFISLFLSALPLYASSLEIRALAAQPQPLTAT